MSLNIGDVVTTTRPGAIGVPLLKQLLEPPSNLNRFVAQPSFPGDQVAGLVSAFGVNPKSGDPQVMILFLGAGALWMSANDVMPLPMKRTRGRR